MSNPPEVCRVMGAWWSIEVRDQVIDHAGEEQSGLFLPESCELVIKRAHDQFMRSSLFHETIHAACPDLSEKQVEMVERGLFAVYCDNKALRDYVFGAE